MTTPVVHRTFAEFRAAVEPSSPVYVDTQRAGIARTGAWFLLGFTDSMPQTVEALPSPDVLEFLCQLGLTRLVVAHIESFTVAMIRAGVRNPPRAIYSEQRQYVAPVVESVTQGKTLTQWQVEYVRAQGMRSITDRYDFEVARILAAESLHGYRDVADLRGTVHPVWNVWTPSGRIVSSAPSLSNLPKSARKDFVADPGYRWILAGYEHPALAAMASMFPSAGALRQLSDLPRAEAVARVAAELGCDTDDADEFLNLLTYRLLTPEVVMDHLGWERARAQTRVAQFHLQYGTATRVLSEAMERVEKATMLGRPLPTPKDSNARIGNLLACVVALVIKRLIIEVYNWAELGSGYWLGLHSAIPMYSNLTYQIDERVRLDGHMRASTSTLISVWQQIFQTPPPPLLWMTGPTWGELTTVTADMVNAQ